MAYTIKKYTVDSVTWTPIRAPMMTNNVTLHNIGANSIKIRTDFNDSDTEKVLVNGDQDVILSPTRQPYVRRFAANEVIVYAQTTTGLATLTGSFQFP